MFSLLSLPQIIVFAVKTMVFGKSNLSFLCFLCFLHFLCFLAGSWREGVSPKAHGVLRVRGVSEVPGVPGVLEVPKVPGVAEVPGDLGILKSLEFLI